MNIQLINALRNRNLFNVKVLDTFIEGDCLQVLFADKEGQWVLTKLMFLQFIIMQILKSMKTFLS